MSDQQLPQTPKAPPPGVQLQQVQVPKAKRVVTPTAAPVAPRTEAQAAFNQALAQPKPAPAPVAVAPRPAAAFGLREEAALRAFERLIEAQAQRRNPQPDLAGDWAWRFADALLKYQNVVRREVTYQNGAVAAPVSPPPPPPPEPEP